MTHPTFVRSAKTSKKKAVVKKATPVKQAKASKPSILPQHEKAIKQAIQQRTGRC